MLVDGCELALLMMFSLTVTVEGNCIEASVDDISCISHVLIAVLITIQVKVTYTNIEYWMLFTQNKFIYFTQL